MTRMKDSGIEWIGEVPEEWGITKFKYFLDTNKGLTITKDNLIEDGIPVINYGQIHSKYGKSVNTDRDELPQVSANYLKFKQSLLKPGDFVFADTSEDIDGSGNFSTRIDDNGELFAGYHTIKAKLKNALEHDFRYFMHYFDSLAFRKQVQNKVSGIKVYSITQTILQETCLIVPSLYEQNQIADFLDKKVAQLDKVKSLLEEQIKTLEDYRRSLIYETVTKGLDKTVPLKDSGVDWIGQIPEGWEVKKHKYIMSKTKTLCSHYSGQKILSLTRQGVISRDVESGKGKMPASFDGYQFLTRGDLLLCLFDIDVTPRCVGIVESDGLTSPAYSRFKVSEDSNVYYYYYLFLAMDDDKVLLHLAKNLRNSLTEADFGDIKTIVPPYKEQVIIANYLNKKTVLIDKLIQLKKVQIENINKQRQTLIYDVVTGKRRV